MRSRQSTVTVYDIAARAECSIATVSRVINGAQNIRPKILARVKQAIDDLGYVPNGSAQQMARKFTGVVGLVYRRWSEQEHVAAAGQDDSARAQVVRKGIQSLQFYDSLFRTVEEAAYLRGYLLLLAGVANEDTPDAVLSLSGKCDGLILIGPVIADRDLAQLARQVPVVSIAHSPEVTDFPQVAVGNYAAMQALAGHMVQVHGARRLAFIGGPEDNVDAVERSRGVTDYAQANGILCEPLGRWAGDFSAGTAFDLVKRRWSEGGPFPDVLLCANDISASGAMAALGELGVRVPEDVAITGFDDMEIARLTSPPLTTIRQPMDLIARAAIDALLSAADDRSVVIAGEMVVRQSCGCK